MLFFLITFIMLSVLLESEDNSAPILNRDFVKNFFLKFLIHLFSESVLANPKEDTSSSTVPNASTLILFLDSFPA